MYQLSLFFNPFLISFIVFCRVPQDFVLPPTPSFCADYDPPYAFFFVFYFIILMSIQKMNFEGSILFLLWSAFCLQAEEFDSRAQLTYLSCTIDH